METPKEWRGSPCHPLYCWVPCMGSYWEKERSMETVQLRRDVEELEFTVEDLIEGGNTSSESKPSMRQESANLQPLLAPWSSETRHVRTSRIDQKVLFMDAYLDTQKSKIKKMALCIGSSHGLSLDTGLLPNHLAPTELLHFLADYLSFTKSTVWNFLTLIFLHNRLFYLPKDKTAPL